MEFGEATFFRDNLISHELRRYEFICIVQKLKYTNDSNVTIKIINIQYIHIPKNKHHIHNHS